MTRIIYIFFICCSLNAFAWNAVGHKVVAQIAYDNLTPNAKKMCNKYLSLPHSKSMKNKFVNSATWMDDIRRKKNYSYDKMHYIDIPFSEDKDRKLPVIDKVNAIWAIKKAIRVYISKNTKSSDKRLALHMLIHIIGDIHQPLHTVSKVSNQYPKGDLGGLLFPLEQNSIGRDLHHYWDRGAGFLLGVPSLKNIKSIARKLEARWPCTFVNNEVNPAKWAKKSYKIAINQVYKIHPNTTPSTQYQEKAQIIVQNQVAFAGCRLAAVLNQAANNKIGH